MDIYRNYPRNFIFKYVKAFHRKSSFDCFKHFFHGISKQSKGDPSDIPSWFYPRFIFCRLLLVSSETSLGIILKILQRKFIENISFRIFTTISTYSNYFKHFLMDLSSGFFTFFSRYFFRKSFKHFFIKCTRHLFRNRFILPS